MRPMLVVRPPVTPAGTRCDKARVRTNRLTLDGVVADLHCSSFTNVVAGRAVMGLVPGANDVGRLAPGVYYVTGQGSRIQGSEGSRVTKVVVTR